MRLWLLLHLWFTIAGPAVSHTAVFNARVVATVAHHSVQWHAAAALLDMSIAKSTCSCAAGVHLMDMSWRC
jgi:hypothetical protein